MIRINLVAERKADKVRKPLLNFESGNEALGNVVMAAVIISALLFSGYKFVSMRSTLAGLEVSIADANLEKERLKDILAKGEAFKAQRELLKRKVELITDLKKNQAVPVHLLDQISRNLPEFLWLDSVSERGNGITLNGKATTYNAVSNFYNNLDASSYFADVVLGTTQQENQGVSFSVSCRFVPVRDQQAEAAAAGDEDGGAPATEAQDV
jgi:type IV pilus assembly protein PilN